MDIDLVLEWYLDKTGLTSVCSDFVALCHPLIDMEYASLVSFTMEHEAEIDLRNREALTTAYQAVFL